MSNERIHKLLFSSVYPLYLQKVEKKGRSKAELDTVISWLTGYGEQMIQNLLERKVDFRTFFEEAPAMNPHAVLITGMICGHRIEEIDDELVRRIRYLDKLVDELAKGRSMDKILRK